MKLHATRTTLAALVAVAACATPHARADEAVYGEPEGDVAVAEEVDPGTFHDRLSPYGQWDYVAPYGDVWVPNGESVGWRPYSDGRWVLTEYGWTFVSDDPWGWATWHYGNWVDAGDYGWAWVPGSVWAPAWVSWRYGGGYACWAPTPPFGYGASVYDYSSPAWVVVPQQHFAEPVARVAMSAGVGAAYVAAAQPLAQPVRVGAVAVNPGPPQAQVAAAVGHPIQPLAAHAVVRGGASGFASAPAAPPTPRAVAQAMTSRGFTPPTSPSRPVPGSQTAMQPARPTYSAPHAAATPTTQPSRPAYSPPQRSSYQAQQRPAYSPPQRSSYEAQQRPAYSPPQRSSYQAPQRPAYSPQRPAYSPPSMPRPQAPQRMERPEYRMAPSRPAAPQSAQPARRKRS